MCLDQTIFKSEQPDFGGGLFCDIRSPEQQVAFETQLSSEDCRCTCVIALHSTAGDNSVAALVKEYKRENPKGQKKKKKIKRKAFNNERQQSPDLL